MKKIRTLIVDDEPLARERLATLLEVSQALSGTLNLKSALQRVLGTLLRHHSVVRGMVTLLRDGVPAYTIGCRVIELD